MITLICGFYVFFKSYERLSVFGTSKNVEIGDLISDLEVIYEKFRDEVKSMGSSACILGGILKTLQLSSKIAF